MAFSFYYINLKLYLTDIIMLKKNILEKIENKQFKNFVVYGFGQIINLISPLLVIPYIVRICGEEGLGKSGVGLSFAFIAIVLVDYGSYINGTRLISINRDNKEMLEKTFNTIYLSKAILLLIVLMFSIIIIFTVPFFYKDSVQILLSLFFVIGQFINPIWFFQGIQNFKWITIINIFSKIVYVLTVFIFIKKPEDYIYVNFFLGSGLIIASSISFIWIYSTYSFSIKNASFSEAFLLIKSEFTLTISQLFLSFYYYAPIMIISFIGGNYMAGQYRIIDQIIMIFRTYFQMFFNFIYADVCLQVNKNTSRGFQKWKIKNGLNYIMVLIVLFIFSLNTKLILTFFKVNDESLDQMSNYLKLGLVIPLLMGVSLSLKQLIFSTNKNKQYIWITILSTIFSVIMMFFLLEFFGLIGAFITSIFIEFIIIISYIVILKRSFFKL